jgi:hypothetical protein
MTTDITVPVITPKVAERSTENKMLAVVMPIKTIASLAGGIDFQVTTIGSFRRRIAEMIPRTTTTFAKGIS